MQKELIVLSPFFVCVRVRSRVRPQMFHTDRVGNASRKNYAMSDTPVDNHPKEGGVPGDKTVSDYPNSKVILQGSTRFLHNENTGIFGTDPESEGYTEARRISRTNQTGNSNVLNIELPGHSYLEAGETGIRI